MLAILHRPVKVVQVVVAGEAAVFIPHIVGVKLPSAVVAEGKAFGIHLNLAALVVHHRHRVFHDAVIPLWGLAVTEKKWGLTGAGGHATLFFMTHTKLEIVRELVKQAPKDALSNHKKRRAFALHMSKALGIWDSFTVPFVEEMAGLSFRSPEDRELFIQFAELGL
jgi:hypothetical protein